MRVPVTENQTHANSKALGKEQELGDRNVFAGSAPEQNHFVKDTVPKAKLLLCFTFLCSFSSQGVRPKKEITLQEPVEMTY